MSSHVANELLKTAALSLEGTPHNEATPAVVSATATAPPVPYAMAVTVCGNVDLKVEGVSDKLHVRSHIGRKKLRAKAHVVDESDVFWLNPRKYWTVSKGESCLQDLSLEIVDSYLAKRKDVVIITDKHYRWRNKDPGKLFYRQDTPGHVVLCTRKLEDLNVLVGPSDSEQLLNTAVADRLYKLFSSANSREGVRQYLTTQYLTTSISGSQNSSESVFVSEAKVPKAPHPKMSRKKTKRTTSREEQHKVEDEYDLGDHATNDDQATKKPNYAKEAIKERKLGKQEKQAEK